MLASNQYGTIIRRVCGGDHDGAFEVATDLVTCLVGPDRDDHGSYDVQVPGYWLHSDSQHAEACRQARMAVQTYLDTNKVRGGLVVTLGDFARHRSKVVLFWASTRTKDGDVVPLGYADIDFAERHGLLQAAGSVDANHSWWWNGQGRFVDDAGHAITQMTAAINESRWHELVEQYQNEQKKHASL
jgi:hypothetical protein